MMNSYLLTQDKEKCYGCRACELACSHSAIRIITDDEGFLYPKLNEDKCINCGLCRKVCPYDNASLKKRPIQWYACWAKSKALLMKSSTGGIFSVIAEYVISQGGVVVGCAVNYKKLKAEHIIVAHTSELDCMRGSKYMQSDTNQTFSLVKEVLKRGLMVYYTGTPCQIAGLRNFLRKEYENLITSDLFCHGVCSNLFFENELCYLERKYKGKIGNFRCRSKRKYRWIDGGVVAFDLTKKNGKTIPYDIPASQSIMYYAFAYADAPYNLRWSCYNCQYRSNERVGDITLGDYWGMESSHPELCTPKRLAEGTALISINTPKAETLFNHISGELEYLPVREQDAIVQDALTGSKRDIPALRYTIYKSMVSMGYEKMAKRYLFTKRYWLKQKKKRLHNILHTIKLHFTHAKEN